MNTQSTTEREIPLRNWLQQIFPFNPNLLPLKGDASFRRYYRINHEKQSYIVMDAPPPLESCTPFVNIAHQLSNLGVHVPKILAQDLNQGFLLLSDFGNHLLWDALSTHSVNHLYQTAFDTLLKIQTCNKVDYPWPEYNGTLYLNELELCKKWYIEGLKQVTLSTRDQQAFNKISELLVADALAQPQVCVHRDYHSRNLMLLHPRTPNINTTVIDSRTAINSRDNSQKLHLHKSQNTHHQTDLVLGVLDFQDAVWGPITYDLVSLLRDCYIDWPPIQVQQWALSYHQLALTAGLLTVDNPQQFLRWLDWMGLQRHLKCLGIFSRLHLLYKRSNYLSYIPRTLNYAKAICHQYLEFNSLGRLLDHLT